MPLRKETLPQRALLRELLPEALQTVRRLPEPLPSVGLQKATPQAFPQRGPQQAGLRRAMRRVLLLQRKERQLAQHRPQPEHQLVPLQRPEHSHRQAGVLEQQVQPVELERQPVLALQPQALARVQAPVLEQQVRPGTALVVQQRAHRPHGLPVEVEELP